MTRLTTKEREIMELLWQHGPMFVRELRELYPEPKPHVNTVSTFIRILEQKGYIGHRQFGNSYQYHALVSEQEYGRSTIAGIVKQFYEGSYLSAVSSFVEEEKISVDELRQLIEQIENGTA